MKTYRTLFDCSIMLPIECYSTKQRCFSPAAALEIL